MRLQAHSLGRLASLLLNTGKVIAGGGIVLTDGEWFSPIAIEMDIKTESVFPVESISLIAAYEIARYTGRRIEIGTDCKGAMGVPEKKNAGFNSILGGGVPDENITITKVKAHPELWGEKEIRDINEKGNWIADHVAGRE